MVNCFVAYKLLGKRSKKVLVEEMRSVRRTLATSCNMFRESSSSAELDVIDKIFSEGINGTHKSIQVCVCVGFEGHRKRM